MDTKVAIITGASSGIGLATANYFKQKGYVVYGIGLRESFECEFNYLSCDVTNEQQIDKIFEQIFQREQRIDVLVNCAGMGISGAVEHTALADVEKIFKINFMGTFICCKHVIKYMRNNSFGRIVNIGSIAGLLAIPFQSFYSATKSAIDNFSCALDSEIKNFGIRVTCVLPGDTKTGFTAARQKNEIMVDDCYKERIKKSISTMEKDEQNGMSPICVSKIIYSVVNRKSPPRTISVGFKYKAFAGLNKILPKRFASFVVSKLYAK